jgi:lipopolysaccharide biosynthesis glycosyltransferase
MITVALCFDSSLQNYFLHVINSVLRHTTAEVRFFLLVDEKTRVKIPESIAHSVTVRTFELPNTFMSKYSGTVRSRAMYARYMIPQLIPEADKVIYFDNDVLVLGDIQELWKTDFNSNILCAVPDRFNHLVEMTRRFQGIPDDIDCAGIENYFSGQLVFDCEAWRMTPVFSWIESYASKGILDMAAMSIAYEGLIKPLDENWCVSANHVDNNFVGQVLSTTGIQYNPKLLHSHGETKFWHWHSRWHELYKEYL